MKLYKNEHMANCNFIIRLLCNYCTIAHRIIAVTDLGVSYDNKFSFRPHINSIVFKRFLRAKLILKCVVNYM